MQDSEPSTSEVPELPAPRRLNNAIVGMYQATSSLAAPTEAVPSLQRNIAAVDGSVQRASGQPDAAEEQHAEPGTTAAVNNAEPGTSQAENPTQQDAPSAANVEATKKAKTRASKRVDVKRDTRALKRLREAGGSAVGAAGPSMGSITAPKKIFYSDLGGIEDVLTDIRQLIEYPLMHPEVPSPAPPTQTNRNKHVLTNNPQSATRRAL